MKKKLNKPAVFLTLALIFGFMCYEGGKRVEVGNRRHKARVRAEAQVIDSRRKAIRIGSLPLDLMVLAKVKEMINEF